jgi:sec-independent protein translocase protein TatA
MEALTPGHLVIILIAFVLLVGYKKLPEASRSVGRSLRIFRSEMRAADEPAADAASAAAGRAPLTAAPSPEELEAEATSAERHAAALRARAGVGPDSSSPTKG